MKRLLRRIYHARLEVGPLLVMWIGLRCAVQWAGYAGNAIRAQRLLPAFVWFVGALAILAIAAHVVWRTVDAEDES